MEEINDIIQQLFNAEAQYFYDHYAQYDPARKIGITISESIYDTIMQLDLSETQKNIIDMQGENITDSLNGSVVLCRDMNSDGVQVIFSMHSFKYNDGGLTLLGTINHELTHANDFMDFAEHLGTNDSETVMHDELWFTVQMWSEFHARRNGFLRVLNAATNNTLQFPEDYMANEIALIRSMWNERREENELYELMQLCGRYSILEELFPDETNGFNEDMLKGVYSGMKLFVCNRIYKFCTEHKTFDVFIKDAEKLRSLIS